MVTFVLIMSASLWDATNQFCQGCYVYNQYDQATGVTCGECGAANKLYYKSRVFGNSCTGAKPLTIVYDERLECVALDFRPVGFTKFASYLVSDARCRDFAKLVPELMQPLEFYDSGVCVQSCPTRFYSLEENLCYDDTLKEKFTFGLTKYQTNCSMLQIDVVIKNAFCALECAPPNVLMLQFCVNVHCVDSLTFVQQNLRQTQNATCQELQNCFHEDSLEESFQIVQCVNCTAFRFLEAGIQKCFQVKPPGCIFFLKNNSFMQCVDECENMIQKGECVEECPNLIDGLQCVDQCPKIIFEAVCVEECPIRHIYSVVDQQACISDEECYFIDKTNPLDQKIVYKNLTINGTAYCADCNIVFNSQLNIIKCGSCAGYQHFNQFLCSDQNCTQISDVFFDPLYKNAKLNQNQVCRKECINGYQLLSDYQLNCDPCNKSNQVISANTCSFEKCSSMRYQNINQNNFICQECLNKEFSVTIDEITMCLPTNSSCPIGMRYVYLPNMSAQYYVCQNETINNVQLITVNNITHQQILNVECDIMLINSKTCLSNCNSLNITRMINGNLGSPKLCSHCDNDQKINISSLSYSQFAASCSHVSDYCVYLQVGQNLCVNIENCSQLMNNFSIYASYIFKQGNQCVQKCDNYILTNSINTCDQFCNGSTQFRNIKIGNEPRQCSLTTNQISCKFYYIINSINECTQQCNKSLKLSYQMINNALGDQCVYTCTSGNLNMQNNTCMNCTDYVFEQTCVTNCNSLFFNISSENLKVCTTSDSFNFTFQSRKYSINCDTTQTVILNLNGLVECNDSLTCNSSYIYSYDWQNQVFCTDVQCSNSQIFMPVNQTMLYYQNISKTCSFSCDLENQCFQKEQNQKICVDKTDLYMLQKDEFGIYECQNTECSSFIINEDHFICQDCSFYNKSNLSQCVVDDYNYCPIYNLSQNKKICDNCSFTFSNRTTIVNNFSTQCYQSCQFYSPSTNNCLMSCNLNLQVKIEQKIYCYDCSDQNHFINTQSGCDTFCDLGQHEFYTNFLKVCLNDICNNSANYNLVAFYNESDKCVLQCPQYIRNMECVSTCDSGEYQHKNQVCSLIRNIQYCTFYTLSQPFYICQDNCNQANTFTIYNGAQCVAQCDTNSQNKYLLNNRCVQECTRSLYDIQSNQICVPRCYEDTTIFYQNQTCIEKSLCDVLLIKYNAVYSNETICADNCSYFSIDMNDYSYFCSEQCMNDYTAFNISLVSKNVSICSQISCQNIPNFYMDDPTALSLILSYNNGTQTKCTQSCPSEYPFKLGNQCVKCDQDSQFQNDTSYICESQCIFYIQDISNLSKWNCSASDAYLVDTNLVLFGNKWVSKTDCILQYSYVINETNCVSNCEGIMQNSTNNCMEHPVLGFCNMNYFLVVGEFKTCTTDCGSMIKLKLQVGNVIQIVCDDCVSQGKIIKETVECVESSSCNTDFSNELTPTFCYNKSNFLNCLSLQKVLLVEKLYYNNTKCEESCPINYTESQCTDCLFTFENNICYDLSECYPYLYQLSPQNCVQSCLDYNMYTQNYICVVQCDENNFWIDEAKICNESCSQIIQIVSFSVKKCKANCSIQEQFYMFVYNSQSYCYSMNQEEFPLILDKNTPTNSQRSTTLSCNPSYVAIGYINESTNYMCIANFACSTVAELFKPNNWLNQHIYTALHNGVYTCVDFNSNNCSFFNEIPPEKICKANCDSKIEYTHMNGLCSQQLIRKYCPLIPYKINDDYPICNTSCPGRFYYEVITMQYVCQSDANQGCPFGYKKQSRLKDTKLCVQSCDQDEFFYNSACNKNCTLFIRASSNLSCVDQTNCEVNGKTVEYQNQKFCVDCQSGVYTQLQTKSLQIYCVSVTLTCKNSIIILGTYNLCVDTLCNYQSFDSSLTTMINFSSYYQCQSTQQCSTQITIKYEKFDGFLQQYCSKCDNVQEFISSDQTKCVSQHNISECSILVKSNLLSKQCNSTCEPPYTKLEFSQFCLAECPYFVLLQKCVRICPTLYYEKLNNQKICRSNIGNNLILTNQTQPKQLIPQSQCTNIIFQVQQYQEIYCSTCLQQQQLRFDGQQFQCISNFTSCPMNKIGNDQSGWLCWPNFCKHNVDLFNISLKTRVYNLNNVCVSQCIEDKPYFDENNICTSCTVIEGYKLFRNGNKCEKSAQNCEAFVQQSNTPFLNPMDFQIALCVSQCSNSFNQSKQCVQKCDGLVAYNQQCILEKNCPLYIFNGMCISYNSEYWILVETRRQLSTSCTTNKRFIISSKKYCSQTCGTQIIDFNSQEYQQSYCIDEPCPIGKLLFSFVCLESQCINSNAANIFNGINVQLQLLNFKDLSTRRCGLQCSNYYQNIGGINLCTDCNQFNRFKWLPQNGNKQCSQTPCQYYLNETGTGPYQCVQFCPQLRIKSLGQCVNYCDLIYNVNYTDNTCVPRCNNYISNLYFNISETIEQQICTPSVGLLYKHVNSKLLSENCSDFRFTINGQFVCSNCSNFTKFEVLTNGTDCVDSCPIQNMQMAKLCTQQPCSKVTSILQSQYHDLLFLNGSVCQSNCYTEYNSSNITTGIKLFRKSSGEQICISYSCNDYILLQDSMKQHECSPTTSQKCPVFVRQESQKICQLQCSNNTFLHGQECLQNCPFFLDNTTCVNNCGIRYFIQILNNKVCTSSPRYNGILYLINTQTNELNNLFDCQTTSIVIFVMNTYYCSGCSPISQITVYNSSFYCESSTYICQLTLMAKLCIDQPCYNSKLIINQTNDAIKNNQCVNLSQCPTFYEFNNEKICQNCLTNQFYYKPQCFDFKPDKCLFYFNQSGLYICNTSEVQMVCPTNVFAEGMCIDKCQNFRYASQCLDQCDKYWERQTILGYTQKVCIDDIENYLISTSNQIGVEVIQKSRCTTLQFSYNNSDYCSSCTNIVTLIDPINIKFECSASCINQQLFASKLCSSLNCNISEQLFKTQIFKYNQYSSNNICISSCANYYEYHFIDNISINNYKCTDCSLVEYFRQQINHKICYTIYDTSINETCLNYSVIVQSQCTNCNQMMQLKPNMLLYVQYQCYLMCPNNYYVSIQNECILECPTKFFNISYISLTNNLQKLCYLNCDEIYIKVEDHYQCISKQQCNLKYLLIEGQVQYECVNECTFGMIQFVMYNLGEIYCLSPSKYGQINTVFSFSKQQYKNGSENCQVLFQTSEFKFGDHLCLPLACSNANKIFSDEMNLLIFNDQSICLKNCQNYYNLSSLQCINCINNNVYQNLDKSCTSYKTEQCKFIQYDEIEQNYKCQLDCPIFYNGSECVSTSIQMFVLENNSLTSIEHCQSYFIKQQDKICLSKCDKFIVFAGSNNKLCVDTCENTFSLQNITYCSQCQVFTDLSTKSCANSCGFQKINDFLCLSDCIQSLTLFNNVNKYKISVNGINCVFCSQNNLYLYNNACSGNCPTSMFSFANKTCTECFAYRSTLTQPNQCLTDKYVTYCPQFVSYVSYKQCFEDCALIWPSGECIDDCSQFIDNSVCSSNCSSLIYIQTGQKICVDICNGIEMVGVPALCVSQCVYQVYNGQKDECLLSCMQGSCNSNATIICSGVILGTSCIAVEQCIGYIINQVCTPYKTCSNDQILHYENLVYNCIKYINQLYLQLPNGVKMVVDNKCSVIIDRMCIPFKCSTGFVWITNGCYQDWNCKMTHQIIQNGICYGLLTENEGELEY